MEASSGSGLWPTVMRRCVMVHPGLEDQAA
jgi:hypothetical protein